MGAAGFASMAPVARKAEYQPGGTDSVFLDPAGHPFCLCVADE